MSADLVKFVERRLKFDVGFDVAMAELFKQMLFTENSRKAFK